jgi:ribosomal protein S18 acetylase RimI-like enzyme
MHFEFKTLVPQDVILRRGELKNLGITAYGSHADAMGNEGASMMRSNLMNEETWDTLFRNSTCFVCLHEKDIVGMAYLILSGNPWKFFEKEWAYIRMVGVLPEFNGHGIGRELTTMCISYAKENHEKTVALHTSEFMHAARHVYESLGFTILKEIAPQWGKQYWVYTLDLQDK